MSDLDIPAFLKREDTPEEKAARAVPIRASRIPPPDNRSAERTKRDLEVLAEFAAVKKAKTRVRIAKLVASKSGATAKMPLQGKAALRVIAGLKSPPEQSEAGTEPTGEDVKTGKKEQALRETREQPANVEFGDNDKKLDGADTGEAVEQSAAHLTEEETGAMKTRRKKNGTARQNARTPVKNGHGHGKTLLAQIVELASGQHGCTRPEVLALTGWTAVSMQQVAEGAGVKLRQEKRKGERHTRYFMAG